MTLHKQVNTGHVWSNFLLARKRTIEWMIEDGKSFTEVAQTLSMDPVQVQLIHMTSEAEMDSAQLLKLNSFHPLSHSFRYGYRFHLSFVYPNLLTL